MYDAIEDVDLGYLANKLKLSVFFSFIIVTDCTILMLGMLISIILKDVCAGNCRLVLRGTF